MLNGIRSVLPSETQRTITLTSPDLAFLREHKVRPWAELPVWMPNEGETLYWNKCIVSKAIAAGLTFRPFATTVQDTLSWHLTRPAENQAKLRSGLTPEREAEILKAWHARKKS